MSAFRKFLVTVSLSLWIAALGFFFGFKFIDGDPGMVFMHFTNVALFISAVFYLLAIVSEFHPRFGLHFYFWGVTAYHSIIWIVFSLFIVIAFTGSILENSIQEYGTEIVMVGDKAWGRFCSGRVSGDACAFGNARGCLMAQRQFG